ncbi:MAG: Hsp20/alpha crystallin family protein [Sulfurimonas sp.]|nr:Hsp20/alpha crystallin family protein [Sulfurimonas sp.]
MNLIYIVLAILMSAILAQGYVIYNLKKEPAMQVVKTQNQVVHNPLEQINMMQAMMNRSFEQLNSVFLNDPFFEDVYKNMEVSPLSDMHETDKEYIIEISLPGALKNNIQINTEGNHLQVSASIQKIKDKNSTDYIYKERYTQHFERSFTLLDDADLTKMQSDYKNGVLRLTIPKKK